MLHQLLAQVRCHILKKTEVNPAKYGQVLGPLEQDIATLARLLEELRAERDRIRKLDEFYQTLRDRRLGTAQPKMALKISARGA